MAAGSFVLGEAGGGGIFSSDGRSSMSEMDFDEDLDLFNGKTVDSVQSRIHFGDYLTTFTIRFTDGSLLKIGAFGLHGGEAGVEVTFEENVDMIEQPE